MDRMFPQMARKHYFVAKNEFGTVQHSVLLERDPSRETMMAAAPSHSPFSLLVTTLLVALCYFVH